VSSVAVPYVAAKSGPDRVTGSASLVAHGDDARFTIG
jgi:hypothetical protein